LVFLLLLRFRQLLRFKGKEAKEFCGGIVWVVYRTRYGSNHFSVPFMQNSVFLKTLVSVCPTIVAKTYIRKKKPYYLIFHIFVSVS